MCHSAKTRPPFSLLNRYTNPRGLFVFSGYTYCQEDHGKCSDRWHSVITRIVLFDNNHVLVSDFKCWGTSCTYFIRFWTKLCPDFACKKEGCIVCTGVYGNFVVVIFLIDDDHVSVRRVERRSRLGRYTTMRRTTSASWTVSTSQSTDGVITAVRWHLMSCRLGRKEGWCNRRRLRSEETSKWHHMHSKRWMNNLHNSYF